MIPERFFIPARQKCERRIRQSSMKTLLSSFYIWGVGYETGELERERMGIGEMGPKGICERRWIDSNLVYLWVVVILRTRGRRACVNQLRVIGILTIFVHTHTFLFYLCNIYLGLNMFLVPTIF